MKVTKRNQELELMRLRLKRLDNTIEDQQKALNHLETNINLLLKSLKSETDD